MKKDGTLGYTKYITLIARELIKGKRGVSNFFLLVGATQSNRFADKTYGKKAVGGVLNGENNQKNENRLFLGEARANTGTGVLRPKLT